MSYLQLISLNIDGILIDSSDFIVVEITENNCGMTNIAFICILYNHTYVQKNVLTSFVKCLRVECAANPAPLLDHCL